MEYNEEGLSKVDAGPDARLDHHHCASMEMPDDTAFVALSGDSIYASAGTSIEAPPVFKMFSNTIEDLSEPAINYNAVSTTEFDPMELPPLPDDLLDLPDMMQMDEPPSLLNFDAEAFAANGAAANAQNAYVGPVQSEVYAAPNFQLDIRSNTDINERYDDGLITRENDSLLESVVADIDRQQPFAPIIDSTAGVTGSDIDKEATEQHIIFTLGGTAYSLPISHITEIGRALPITPLPNVPSWVLGVSNLRGDIVSVVDLPAFLGKEPLAHKTRDCRMMVVRSRREDITTALLVDRVREIGHLVPKQVAQPTASIEDQSALYMRGVYDLSGQLLILLDPEQLMLSTEMRQFESRNDII